MKRGRVESKEALAQRRLRSKQMVQQALSGLMAIPDTPVARSAPLSAPGVGVRPSPSGTQALGSPGSATEAVFNTALQKLIAASGGKIKVTSGKRSTAQQAALYKQKPHLAAKPGHSKHERGTAADLAYADDAARQWAHANAAQFGLKFPMLTRAPGKKFEPWHVEL
jgi:hypothetical protein